MPENPQTNPVPRFFYGWVVVGISFMTEFVATGFVGYAFAIVMTQLAAEFSGGDRTPIFVVQMVGTLVTLPLSPYLGRLVGRGWVRPLMTGGAVVTGLGLLGVSRAQELWQFALCFAVFLSMGGLLLSGVPPTSLVINWFERRRAIALGVTALGASIAGVVMAPVTAWLVELRGWRGAYEVLGIAALCLAPIIFMLVVGRPENRGLRPDGDPAQPNDLDSATATASAAPASAFRTSDALREPNLWRIALVAGIAFMATGTLIGHVVAFGTDAGFSRPRAAVFASTSAAGAATGKLVFGWLCDRVGSSTALMFSVATQAIGFGALVGVDGYALLVGVTFLVGLGCGGIYPLTSALLAETFGRDNFAPMFGVMWLIASPAALVGPLAAARIYDQSGSYDMAFLMIAAALLGALFLVRTVRPSEAAAVETI